MNARSSRYIAYVLYFSVTIAPVFSASVYADEVYLSDGSKIVGQIVSQVEGNLTIVTEHAGELTIDASAITGFAADRAMNVQLESGDRITGTPTLDAEGQQFVSSEALGRVAVPADTQVTAMWEAGTPSPVLAAQRSQVEALEAEIEQFRNPWSSRLELGLSGSTGNNERLSLNARVSAKREVENERLYLSASGFYSEENNARTKNEILGEARLERDISDRFFVYGKGGLEYDEFENLDLRSTLTAGLGYFVIKEGHHEFKLRGGVGYQHETFADGTNDDDVILDLGYDYRIDLNSYLRFTQSLTFYPSLEDPASDYRLMVETAGEVPLSGDEAWKLRMGVKNDYDAQPRPGIERLDTTYFLNLAYDF